MRVGVERNRARERGSEREERGTRGGMHSQASYWFSIGFKQMVCTVATCYWILALLWFYKTRSFLSLCPASQVKKNQVHLLNREPLSWFCVSDLLLLIRRELLRAVTLDDSKTPTPVLHNTSVVV